MATIGRINIQVGASTGGLKKGFASARASVQQFTGSISTGIGPLAKFAAKVTALGAGFIGLRSAFGTVSDAFDEVDTLAKTADKLGTTTEALAGLRHAAELTGAGTRTLDMGLQRMTRRVSEAAQGSGEAQGALRELGLDAKALAKLTPDQQFARIADSMNQVDNQADRVRLTFKLFDSEGVNLVNTLKLGSKGLREAGMEAEQLGLAVSRVEAAKIEEANDAVTRLKGAFAGVGRTAATSIAPLITNLLPQVGLKIREAIFFVRNFGTVWEIAKTSATLQIVRIAETVKHFATAEIPAFLRFIRDNWKTIFTDIFNFTKTVFSNVGENAKRLGSALVDALKGKGFQVDFKGLTEGFDRQTPELELPTRVKSAAEESLEKDLAGMANKLGAKFGEEFAPAVLKKAAEDLGIGDGAKLQGGTSKNETARGVTGAFLEGSAEAIRASRGGGENIAQQDLKEQRRQTQLLEQSLRRLERLVQPKVVPFSPGGTA